MRVGDSPSKQTRTAVWWGLICLRCGNVLLWLIFKVRWAWLRWVVYLILSSCVFCFENWTIDMQVFSRTVFTVWYKWRFSFIRVGSWLMFWEIFRCFNREASFIYDLKS
uniref:Uncharacterized protein n=1 Tax=Cacopsylla melanoneura TaxID=428564 RepID=A0A8D8Y8P4_9HEMI